MDRPRRSSRLPTRALPPRCTTAAPTQRRGKQQRKGNRGTQAKPWDAQRSKLKGILSKIRLHQHLLDSYAHDGFKGANREKLKPQAELERARRRIAEAKAEARALLRTVTEAHPGGVRWDSVPEDSDGQLDLDEVACTECGLCTAGDDNDILLCDFEGCFRAFHQRCLSPPLPTEAMPGEEEDWFCPQCECLTDGLELIEEEFGRRGGKELSSWRDVFPEVASHVMADGSGDESMKIATAARGVVDALVTEELFPDSEEDEEFVLSKRGDGEGGEAPEKCDASGRGGDSDGDDGSSDASASDSDESVSSLGSVDDTELQQLSDAGSIDDESESNGLRDGGGSGDGGSSSGSGSSGANESVDVPRARRRSRRQARLNLDGQLDQLPTEDEYVGQRVLVAPQGTAGSFLAGTVAVCRPPPPLAAAGGAAAVAKVADAAATVKVAPRLPSAAVSPRRRNALARPAIEPVQQAQLSVSARPQGFPRVARRAPPAEGSLMSGGRAYSEGAAAWECRFENGSVRLLSAEEVRSGIRLLRQVERKTATARSSARPPAAVAAAPAVAESGALDVANILSGRRRRSAVNYIKLNEEMFGGGGYSAELDGDDEGSGGGDAAPSRSRSGGGGLGELSRNGGTEVGGRPKKRKREPAARGGR